MLRTPSIYATATPIMRPMLRVILTAIAFGAAGLVAGILVPIVRDPTTAQGPLLGVLITGPLGFVIGGHIGVLWSAHRRKQTTTAEIAWLLAFALLILLFYEFFAVIGAALSRIAPTFALLFMALTAGLLRTNARSSRLRSHLLGVVIAAVCLFVIGVWPPITRNPLSRSRIRRHAFRTFSIGNQSRPGHAPPRTAAHHRSIGAAPRMGGCRRCRHRVRGRDGSFQRKAVADKVRRSPNVMTEASRLPRRADGRIPTSALAPATTCSKEREWRADRSLAGGDHAGAAAGRARARRVPPVSQVFDLTSGPVVQRWVA